jgi:hypothetical protein
MSGRGGRATRAKGSHWHRFRALYALIAVCAAPAIAAYFAYFVFPPPGRTNYGDLVSPQRPLPSLTLNALDGTAFDVRGLRGRWVMLQVDASDCGDECERKLWSMRQVRLTAGKDRERVERVWLVLDQQPLTTRLLREYEGTRFLRARTDELHRFLTLPSAGDAQLTDHVWLIDPLGNLMLRWPKDADPNRMKKDLARLLRASQVG